jgi:hypothetical protein
MVRIRRERNWAHCVSGWGYLCAEGWDACLRDCHDDAQDEQHEESGPHFDGREYYGSDISLSKTFRIAADDFSSWYR